MKALLLAAGLGSRLRPLTDVLPKCLVPVNGRPFLEYWIQPLLQAGVDGLLVNTHYHVELVTRFLAGRAWPRQVTAVHEERLLGTGGTLLANRNFFGEGPLMLVHADNLCGCDFAAFMAAHARRPAGTVMTMMTFTSPTPHTCGIVECDSDGIVRKFFEKVADPPGDLANGAVYIVEPPVVDFMARMDKASIDFSTEVVPHFLGKIFAFHNGVYHRDIGNTRSFWQAQAEWAGPAPAVPGPDPWPAICAEKGPAVLAALAAGLSARAEPLVPGAACRWLNGLPAGKDTDCATVLKVADGLTPEAERWLRTSAQDAVAGAGRYLAVADVPPGFSSRTLFKQYGYYAAALCAAATTGTQEGRRHGVVAQDR